MNTDSKSTAVRQEKNAQNKYWLQTHVNDILEPMMLACCQANPTDQVSTPLITVQIGFMIKYLEDKYGERASQGDKKILEFMRSEASRLESLVEQQKKTGAKDEEDEKSERGSENETDESVSELINNTVRMMRTIWQTFSQK